MLQRLSANSIQPAVSVHTLMYYLFFCIEYNLSDLTIAFYDDAAEATNCFAVDMRLIGCKLHIMKLHSTYFLPKKRKIASGPDSQDSKVQAKARICSEVELAVETVDPATRKKVCVTGCADWGFGYSSWGGAAHGPFLVAMGAERCGLFFLPKVPIRLDTDTASWPSMREIESSAIYNVLNPEGGKTIFNLIVTILESAIKSTPIVTPTKAGEQQDKESSVSREEVWSRVYVPYYSDEEDESAHVYRSVTRGLDFGRAKAKNVRSGKSVHVKVTHYVDNIL